MDNLVLEKGGILAEGLPTLTALIWPLARVHPLVYCELCAHAEGFSTFITFIRFYSSVSPFMFSKG